MKTIITSYGPYGLIPPHPPNPFTLCYFTPALWPPTLNCFFCPHSLSTGTLDLTPDIWFQAHPTHLLSFLFPPMDIYFQCPGLTNINPHKQWCDLLTSKWKRTKSFPCLLKKGTLLLTATITPSPADMPMQPYETCPSRNIDWTCHTPSPQTLSRC